MLAMNFFVQIVTFEIYEDINSLAGRGISWSLIPILVSPEQPSFIWNHLSYSPEGWTKKYGLGGSELFDVMFAVLLDLGSLALLPNVLNQGFNNWPILGYGQQLSTWTLTLLKNAIILIFLARNKAQMISCTGYLPFIKSYSLFLNSVLLLGHSCFPPLLHIWHKDCPIIMDLGSAVAIILDSFSGEITASLRYFCRHRKQRGRRQILKAPWGKEWSSSIWIDVHLNMTSSPHHFPSSSCQVRKYYRGWVGAGKTQGWLDGPNILFSCFSLSIYNFCNICKKFIWQGWEEDVPNSSFDVLKIATLVLIPRIYGISNQTNWFENLGLVGWCSPEVCVPPLFYRGRTSDSPFMVFSLRLSEILHRISLLTASFWVSLISPVLCNIQTSIWTIWSPAIWIFNI